MFMFSRKRRSRLTRVKWGLWVLGSIFLTYLTVKTARDAWRPKRLAAERTGTAERSPVRDWLSGLGLAVASPTVIAWFALAAGPIIAGMHIGKGEGLILFTTGFFLAGLIWSVAVAAASGMSGTLLKGPIVRLLTLGSAALFCYFAVKVFIGGLRDLAG